MSLYAKETVVPIEKTQAEIRAVLTKYGATAFAYMDDQTKAAIQFEAAGRRIRFLLVMPDPDGKEFKHPAYRRGKLKTWEILPEEASRKKWEQACRQRWRALLLTIKAKLEAAAAGIETFEEAFMPHIVMPDGKTLSQHVTPQIGAAYASGKMPPMRLGWGDAE
jgi:hypothetical protein